MWTLSSKSPSGYRGYISSRPIAGSRTPQHVQNLVIRDYAARRGLMFKLSLTEYAMLGAFMQLRLALNELPHLEGIIVYSMFMLPSRKDKRQAIYEEVLGLGRQLHFAVEDLTLEANDDIDRLETLFRIDAALRCQDLDSMRTSLKP